MSNIPRCFWSIYDPSMTMRSSSVRLRVPDSIRSERRAGVPTPMPILREAVSLVWVVGKGDVPCALQKLFGFFQFDVLCE